jgi:hypothetical protein
MWRDSGVACSCSRWIRKTKSDDGDRDSCELLQKAATGNGSQRNEVTHEVADRVAGMDEMVKADKQFAEANN